MSRQLATERQVWDWLADLGKLVAPGNASVREASGHYLPLLLAEFDSRDFNAHSRAFVARHCKFWPSYGELCELLAKWPKPAPMLRGGADAGDLAGTDLHWFRYFHKRQAEGFRAARDGQLPSSRESVLALVRDKSIPAWCRITGTSMPEHHEPTEDELQAVHAAVLRARRGGGDRRSEEQQEAADYRTPPRPNLPSQPYRDVTLKGDALRASRAARGITTPLADEVVA